MGEARRGEATYLSYLSVQGPSSRMRRFVVAIRHILRDEEASCQELVDREMRNSEACLALEVRRVIWLALIALLRGIRWKRKRYRVNEIA